MVDPFVLGLFNSQINQLLKTILKTLKHDKDVTKVNGVVYAKQAPFQSGIQFVPVFIGFLFHAADAV